MSKITMFLSVLIVFIHCLSPMQFSLSLDKLLELLCSDLEAETVEAVNDIIKDLQEKCDACGKETLVSFFMPINNVFLKWSA